MATATIRRTQVPPTLVPVEVYLRTTYRPDVDYLEGELNERNLGERPHAYLQVCLGAIFYNHREPWSVVALTEQRVQISPVRYRIPDLCILRASDPDDLIVCTPPLLCIEILSQADTLSELQDRVDDYQSMGVGHIWAIDPWKRKGYVATSDGFLSPANDIFIVPNTPIRITLAEMFAGFKPSKA